MRATSSGLAVPAFLRLSSAKARWIESAACRALGIGVFFKGCSVMNTPLHWTCARTTLTRPLARSAPAADCA